MLSNSENDSFFGGELFQAFFKSSGQSLILKADAPLFTILAVSDHYLGITHKKREELLNRGLFEVYPGNDADPSERDSVLSSFTRVMETGLPDVLPTFKYEIYLAELERLSTQYWSNLNEPLLDAAGNVAYLINTTTNVTEQILSHWELTEARQLKEAFSNEQDRNEALLAFNENLASDNVQLELEQKSLQELIVRLTEKDFQLEQAELTLRLAIEAANVGTWYIHCANRELHVSARLKDLFGFYPDEALTLHEFGRQITEDHRERIKATLEQAMLEAGPYDESYPVTGFNDHKIRWVRALGNTSVQPGGELAFSGVIMDITDLKEDEQRKNDFISMVSHELRSPLTALSGYAQILNLRAKNSEDTFTAGILDKMNSQVKKMTGMINGFLNRGHLGSGKIHLQCTEFNIEDLVNELISEVRLTGTTHVVTAGRCEPVQVFADRDKIGNVISNLLSNAVKYSPRGGHIVVSCAERPCAGQCAG